MENLSFTAHEILALIGIAQSVYILIYMLMRAGKLSRAGLPILYFLIMTLAFIAEFSHNYIADFFTHYDIWTLILWLLGPPLSVLMVVQIARINKAPRPRSYLILTLVPLAYIIAKILSTQTEETLYDWLTVTGLIASALSLLTIWLKRNLMDGLYREKAGRERYWLILAIVFANIFYMIILVMSSGLSLSEEIASLSRIIIGLAFVYLVTTSLFRIYPQAINLKPDNAKTRKWTEDEQKTIEKIANLLERDKVYQDANYSRSDLARECNVPEGQISKVINDYFGKSLPQLFNEKRVDDAKQLLIETNAAVKIIAEETGFNALATFNRVFKDITGTSPTEYRDNYKKHMIG